MAALLLKHNSPRIKKIQLGNRRYTHKLTVQRGWLQLKIKKIRLQLDHINKTVDRSANSQINSCCTKVKSGEINASYHPRSPAYYILTTKIHFCKIFKHQTNWAMNVLHWSKYRLALGFTHDINSWKTLIGPKTPDWERKWNDFASLIKHLWKCSCCNASHV